MKNRNLAIIQARMGSTRLPNKVLLKVRDVPLLEHLVRRVLKAKKIDKIVIATTLKREDSAIEELGRKLKIDCFRGAEEDVLDRYYQCSKNHPQYENIVRLTGDCPLIDPALIDELIGCFESGDYDYLSNTEKETFPDGIDIEIFKKSALEEAANSAKLPSEREHVTRYIRENEKFKRKNISAPNNWAHFRLTVDEPEDFEVVKFLIENSDPAAGFLDYISILTKNPKIMLKNMHIMRNEGLLKSLSKDQTAGAGSQKSALGEKTKKGVRLWNRAKKIIPGGSQLLSKRSEMFLPELWPSYFQRAKGVEVWDLDNDKYIDMSYMGLGACVLGYADDEVDAEVRKAISQGVMSTLNCPEEVELAQLLLELHPWAEMARYTRTGGEAMAVAVRIARAATGKDKVAFCGYHGFHDWYLSANIADESNLDGHLIPGLEPRGVPRALKGTAIPFNYNKIGELEKIVKENDIGVIVMEPTREHEPEKGFLEGVRAIADKIGAVLVFDEISSGFRMNTGGIHLLYNVKPDMAVFAKAMSNGYAMAAVIGRAEIMQAAQTTFISSTYWTERIGPAAALAAIKKFDKDNVSSHLINMGESIGRGWKILAEKHKLDIEVMSIPSLITFKFNCGQSQAVHTLFTQEMLKRGFLASKSVYVSWSHKDKHIKAYLEKADEVFAIIKGALENNKIHHLLEGPIAHAGFKRLT